MISIPGFGKTHQGLHKPRPVTPKPSQPPPHQYTATRGTLAASNTVKIVIIDCDFSLNHLVFLVVWNEWSPKKSGFLSLLSSSSPSPFFQSWDGWGGGHCPLPRREMDKNIGFTPRRMECPRTKLAIDGPRPGPDRRTGFGARARGSIWALSRLPAGWMSSHIDTHWLRCANFFKKKQR